MFQLGRADDADVAYTQMQRCSMCAQYFRGTPLWQVVQRLMLNGELWERVVINITGSQPKSINGNEYTLIVIDYFSKWAEANLLKDHKVPTLATVLVE